MKSASCTTTSLFIVIFSKNSFFIRPFKLCNCLATAFVLKSGCKGSQFYNTKQIFLWKMCSKTYCFRFVLQNRGKYGRFHLLYIHAREEDCGRKQGIEKWRKGCIREGKGTIRSKKAMENVKIMQEKEERDGRSTLNAPVRDKVFLSRTGVFLWTFIGILPSDNLIYNFLLLQAASSQIDTCCLYAFVSHQVGRQGYIVELLQEFLGFLQDFR